MRKIISLILALVFILAIPLACAFTAGAEEITKVVLEGETYEVPVGETFIFETRVTMPGYAAAGGVVIIQFDMDKLEVVKNSLNQIYETDLDGLMTVGDYTADGMGCSFAFASAQFSSGAIMNENNSLLVRFLFRAKAAGTAEIKFLYDEYSFSVFSIESTTTPIAVVSNGKTTNAADGYTFVGNSITVKKVENYQEYEWSGGNGGSNGSGENGSSGENGNSGENSNSGENGNSGGNDASDENGDASGSDGNGSDSSGDSQDSNTAGDNANDGNSADPSNVSGENGEESDNLTQTEGSGAVGISAGIIVLIVAIIIAIAAVVAVICVVVVKKKKE